MPANELKPCSNHYSHGHTVGRKYSPTYHSWQAMIGRCRYQGRDNADRYTKKGISVCERWNSFENFLADMGERPAGKTLDRIDGDKDYSPENCRWSTPTEQARNTRRNVLTLDTAVEVAVLRLDGIHCKEISAMYGISESLPREIVAGRCWKDALQMAHEIRNSRHEESQHG